MNSIEQAHSPESSPIAARPVQELLSGAPAVRRRAVVQLGQCGGSDSLEVVDAIAEDLDEEVYFFARVALDQILERTKPDRVIPESPIEKLCQGFASPDPKDRVRAARICYWQRHPVLLQALVGAAERETDVGVLALLARAVAAYHGDGLCDRVVAMIEHGDARVRACSIEGAWGWQSDAIGRAVLGHSKDPGQRVRANVLVFYCLQETVQRETLIQTMLRSDKSWIRLAATYGLGRLKSGWAVSLLGSASTDPAQPPLVRTLARLVLPPSMARERRTSEMVAPVPDPTIRTELTQHLPAIPDVKTLLECLNDRDSLVRIHGLQNIRRFPAGTSIEKIRAMARDETDPMVTATVVQALGILGGSDEREMILGHLSHDDGRVRANAVEVLTGLDVVIAGDTISRLLDDEAPRVRVQTAHYLFRRDPDLALRTFRKMLLGDEEGARKGAFVTLSRLRDEKILDLFREALMDRRRAVYSPARDTLRELAGDWPPAGRLLLDYEQGRVAGEIAGGEPVAALLVLMDSPFSNDRISAMKKLVWAEDSRVDLMLELNLAAKDYQVRHEAAQALSRRHKEKTLPALMERLASTYLDLSSAGHALVPHHIALDLGRISQGFDATSPLALVDMERVDAMRQELGGILYRAYDRHVPLDEMLRTICQEISSARGQVDPGAGPGEMASDCLARLMSAGPEMVPLRGSRTEGVESPAGTEEPLSDAVDGATASTHTHLSYRVVAAATVLFVVAAFEVGRWWEGKGAGAGPLVVTGSPVTLDKAMNLETDPRRFVARYRGTRLDVGAQIVSLDPAQRHVVVHNGTIYFDLALDPTQRFPDTKLIGQRLDFKGVVGQLDAAGRIKVNQVTLRSRN